MKIAMISSGSSIHVKKIANALVERGYEITLYTLPNHDKLLGDFDKRIKVIKLPIKGKLGYYLNAPFIRNDLKRNPVDIVNSHYASGYGTLARFVGKHPLALAVFGSDVFEYPFQSAFTMRTVIKNLDFADVITSTSHVMANKVREFYHKDRDIIVTPFGVDLNRFHPVKVKKDDCFEIGIVKKIEKNYGIDLLIKAFALFMERNDYPKSRLIIYGRGSAMDELKQLVKSTGERVQDSVVFAGFVSNELVPEKLSHMDVACFPSISESFGVAAVEAMACGIPVIASDASGFTEVIDSETGIVVPKNSVEALAKAITTVYRMDHVVRASMGQAGIKRVRERYNFRSNMDTYEEALKRAVQ